MKKTELSLSIDDFITGSGGGKQKQRAPVESPNTLQSRATIKVVEVVSEGEVLGLVGGLKGVYFDDTAVQNQDDSYNFPSIIFDQRLGTPDQTYMPGFPQVEAASAVNVELDTTGVTRTVTSGEVDAVRVMLRLPQGLSYLNTENGDLSGYRVGIAIDTRPVGGTWTMAFSKTITGKAVTPYEESYRVERPEGIASGGLWELRVRRTGAPGTTSNITDRVDWFTLSEIQDIKVYYEDAAVVGLAIDSESTGGSVPKRSYLIDGLIVKVPTNYTPTVYNPDGTVAVYASYSGSWNGTFKDAWCDDPAWIVYALLTNEKYGMGEFVNQSHIDIYSFYEASQYNCQLINDGTGTATLEPRFRCNTTIQVRDDAYKIVQAIAATMRAVVFQGPGLIKLLQDRPMAPSATLTNANVIDGVFAYTGTELSTRITSCDVTFNDIEDRYLPRTINEQADEANIENYGFNKIELSAIGVVTEGQARRLAKWTLDTALNANEMVSFQVSWNNAFIEIGDVVNIADNWYANIAFSGLIVNDGVSDVNSIKLDRTVTATAGQTIKFMKPDGVEITRTVAASTTGSTLTLTTLGGSANPRLYAGCAWMLLGTVNPRQFKITSVSEESPGVYNIGAAAYDPTKYARVEQGVYVNPPVFTTVGSGTIAAPTNITVTPETFIDPNGNVKYRLRFNWDDVVDPFIKEYRLRYRRNNNNYLWAPTVPLSEYVLDDVEPGVYEFTVHAYNTRGVQSPGLSGYYEFSLNSEEPSPITVPTGLLLASGGTAWTGPKFDIAWSAPPVITEATLKDYRIQIIKPGATLPEDVVVKTLFQTGTTLTITNTDVIAWCGSAIRNVKVKVSARDTLLRYSLPATTTFTNNAPSVPANPTLATQWQYYILKHDASLDADAAGVRIHHSLTSGFTPSSGNIAKTDSGSQHFVEALPDQTYYVKYAAYDTWGVDELTFSSEYSIVTQSEDGLAGEIQDRINADAAEAAARAAAIAAEAQARADAIAAEAAARAAAISQEVTDRTNAVTAETNARIAAINAEASARAAALTSLADSVGTDITNERILRESGDDALAATIATLTAGGGEQFDSKVIWYFDSALESWTGNGTPTVAGGYLRAANDLSNPYLASPTGLNINTASYRYVKARIKRTGTPTWEGSLKWRNPADAAGAWNGPFDIAEPTFDANGIATVDFKAVTWSGTIDQIRLELSSVQSANDYFEIDWVAVGRPSPGASVAALEEEKQARITGDSAEATQRTTLASQIRGAYTGTDINVLSSGLLYNELIARTTADSSMASSITALETTVNHPTTGVSATGNALNTLTTRVTNAEGVNTSQGSAITALQGTVNDPSTGVTATSDALNTLTTRVTNTENTNTTQGDAITSLQNTVNDPSTGVNATASAVTGLSNRVTTVEGNVSTLSSSVTSLNNTVNGKITAFAQATAPSTTGRVVGDLWLDTDDGNKLYSWDGSAWAVRALATGNKVWAQPAQPGATGNTTNDLWIDTDDNNKLYRWNGTAWTAADDGRISLTASALTTLTTRVTNTETVNATQSDAITTLQNTVNDPSTGVNATSSALSALTSRVTSAEGVNSSQGSAITTLQNTVNNGTTGVNATASGLSSLTTRVTNAEGVNTSQGSAITTLQNTVNNGTTGVVATANGLSALTTRVTNAEGVNTSQGSAITTLQNTVNHPSTGVNATATSLSTLTNRVTTAEANITSQSNSITSLSNTVNNPSTGLAATVSALTDLRTTITSSGNLLTNSGFATDINGWLVGWNSANDPNWVMQRDLAAPSWLIGGTHSIGATHPGAPNGTYYAIKSTAFTVEPGQRYGFAALMAQQRCGEGVLILEWFTANGTPISSVNGQYWNGSYDVNGNKVMTQFVTAGGGTNYGDWQRPYGFGIAPSNARIARLWFRAYTNGQSNPYIWMCQPTVFRATDAQVDPADYGPGGVEMNAAYTLKLDVNGYVTGFQSTNDGATGTFDILADKFRIVAPGAGQTPKIPFAVEANQVKINTDLYMGNGRIVAQAGGFMKVQGVGFGSANQFIEWFGPVMALTACAENNGIAYQKIDGTAYFGGTGFSGSTGAIKLDPGTFASGDGYTASTCTYELGNTGVLSILENSTITTARPANSWMTPVNATLASTYECMVTPTSGSFSSGSPTGTWLPLSTTRSWSVTKSGASGGGVKTCVFTVQIRKTGEPTILGSASVNLKAYGDSGGYNECVLANSFLPDGRRAGDVQVGDTMLLAHHETLEGFEGEVQKTLTAWQECVRMVTVSGVALGCSVSAPIPVQNTEGGYKHAGELLEGDVVPVMVDGEKRWEPLAAVESIGRHPVQHISVQDECFWAGEEEGKFILHHNIQYKPE